MKRLLFIMLTLILLAALLTACQAPGETTKGEDTEDSDTAVTTAAITTEAKLSFVENGKTEYTVVVAEALYQDTAFCEALEAFCEALGEQVEIQSDRQAPSGKEILVGTTNREASLAHDAKYMTNIRIDGDTLVITGENTELLTKALSWFSDNLIVDRSVVLPVSFVKSFPLNMSTSLENGKTFEAMADEVYDSFNKKYFKNGWVQGHAYWDKAEMIETYIDVYEATGSQKAKEKLESYTKMFLKLYHEDWSRNEYNDDIMWACIGFSRMAKLFGNKTYAQYAKTNFDIVWERAYDDVLGGGLYWRIENETKNSCVNCPGAIAACLIAELTGDRSYYDKAKLLMEWEFANMFEPDTGRVYDAYNISGKINKWASTYNQGTFIGACTLLHEAFGDEKYLDYAAKAAEYAMTKLVNKNGIIDNGEASLSNRDLPGFKGILVRWLYRYAKYTSDLDILAFLQKNASHVYQMKNTEGLIWTDWAHRTPAQDTIDRNENYCVFGMSTAVALMYNALPWW